MMGLPGLPQIKRYLPPVKLSKTWTAIFSIISDPITGSGIKNMWKY
jgi:hypothetical protein